MRGAVRAPFSRTASVEHAAPSTDRAAPPASVLALSTAATRPVYTSCPSTCTRCRVHVLFSPGGGVVARLAGSPPADPPSSHRESTMPTTINHALGEPIRGLLLDDIEFRFHLCGQGPHPLSLDGRRLGHGLPARLI